MAETAWQFHLPLESGIFKRDRFFFNFTLPDPPFQACKKHHNFVWNLRSKTSLKTFHRKRLGVGQGKDFIPVFFRAKKISNRKIF